MSYNEITTIVNLLSLVHPELLLISKLNNFFNFDHNVFLLDESADENRFINTNVLKDYTPQSLYVLHNVNGTMTGSEMLTEIRSKNTFVVVAPGSPTLDSIVNLLNQIEKLQTTEERLHINMKIGIFFKHFVEEKDSRNLFEWCWERGIIDIFAATYSTGEQSSGTLLNIFTFNPFETFRVINVTGTESFNDYFLKQNCNFQQHPLRIGRSYIRLSDKMVWLSILSLINASASFVNATEPSDIYPGLYYMSRRKRGFMYPVKMESEVLVVPQSLPYSEFSAYLRSLTSEETFGYSFITIAAVIGLLTICRYIKRNEMAFFQSAADVLNLLMNDNGGIEYQRLSRIEVFIIVPLTFIGFVIVNGILSNLQSYLTRPILQPQIDDIEKIYRSQIPIFTLKERENFEKLQSWKDRLVNALQNRSIHRDWADKIHEIDGDLLDNEINHFNTSIGFLWNEPTIETMLRIQKQLNIRGYHQIEATVYTQHLTYLLNDTFPFMERLNDLVSRTKSAGLYDKWLRLEYGGLEREVRKNVEHLKDYAARDIEPVSVPMFIVYGWMAGIVVLVGEIIWKRIKFSSIKMLKRILRKRIW